MIEEPLKEGFPSDKEFHGPAPGDQTQHAFRPKVDPSETSLLLFPGQGSQFVGMGKQLLEYQGAQEIYEAANEILGYNLLDLCLNGPKTELDKTVFCQPAVFVTSIAATQKLQELYPDVLNTCIGSAGFSVGEYAALVYSGVLPFEDALKIVKLRAEEMQKASEVVHSGMMTVFLKNESKLKQAMYAARKYCEEKLEIEDPVCGVANYISFDCKVIAGNIEALKFIQDNKNLFEIKRTIMVPVSGAFHTPLMQSARQSVVKALKKTEFSKPLFRVHSNVTAKNYKRSKDIIDLLGKQIIKPVKWEQTLHVLYARKAGENFPQTYEVGPGNQLGTMLKMVNFQAYKNYTNIPV
ncbi:hypothetical protein LOTGIDRAFT_114671 [Lottia gigantea]|uniref:[acyl-carrier-protein] S-malonyltransferase n=1 Tax=Lottia gigantea TaxID=225164 RepID=V4AM44_LOTGI|nr:hypothetical protein LOTGIDRAFT_114671 [Lottia gigantea]ESO98207.1 hypothetical protein LOTGIDRAFT_114671 [Lottia gigantea]